jgi:hypothetical protein
MFPPSIYRTPAPNRGASGWGQPWWPTEAAKKHPFVTAGPDTPRPHEAYRASQEAAGRIAQAGSQNVAQHASVAAALAGQFAPILDALSRGAFSSSYSGAVRANMEAQLQNMRIQQQQMLMQNEAGIAKHRQEMLEYGRIFNAHEKGELSDEEAKELAFDIARRTNHPMLINAINEKGIKGAWDQLNWEDAQSRQWEAAHTTLRKATAGQTDADEAAEFDDTSASGGAGPGGAAGGFSLPRVGADAGTQTASAATSDAEEDPESLEDQLKKQEYTPAQIDAIHGILNDEPPDAYKALHKGGAQQRKIAQGALQAQAQLDHTLQGEGTPEEKLAAIHDNIDPGVADTLQGLHSYTTDPAALGSPNKRDRYVKMMASLDPKWKSNGFKLIQQYEQSNQPQVKTVQRVSAFLPAVESLNSAMLQIPEDQKIAPNTLKKVYANTWTGDPTYTQIYTAIQNVLNETSAIQNQGVPRVGQTKARAQEMLNTMSPAQIRVQLLEDAKASYGYVRSINDNFKEIVGDPKVQAPFYPKSIENDYKAILRMNPYTGEVPKDASGVVRATGRPHTDTHPSWLKSDQAWTPLTEPQVIEGRKQIKENLNSPDPAVQAKIQRIRQRLGIFAEPEPGDPDYAP